MQQAIDILDEMIRDAEKSMYPEKGQPDMKEFNIFSCGKASLEIAKSRIQALGAGWIPVTERLPNDLGNVLIHGPSIHFIGWFYPAENCWYNENGNINCKITHWMPLPLPPKQ